ncbi:MAG: hypothetical protein WCO00_18220 [Rhodospirillaceae bacterium]
MTADRETAAEEERRVRHFRQILLWPVHLMPVTGSFQGARRWEELCRDGDLWSPVTDEFPADASQFQIRHYNEFVTFLPAVQRFLYGEARRDRSGDSPIRVFRRSDVKMVRLTLKDRPEPVALSIAHVDLYFFYDIDVTLFTVEVYADDLELGLVQELLFRFGRAFPTGWDHEERGDHCLVRTEWLDDQGRVLATSDFDQRGKFLATVCQERTAAISADWEFLLGPMVPDASARPGGLRFRQLEYSRMPLMAYLAFDQPRALSRGDFARLVFAARSGPTDQLPVSESFLADFEAEYCYDRYWGLDSSQAANTRFLCSGQAFVVVGEAGQRLFTDPEQGVLAQFRHQYFLLGLIAHFQKAALLMFADRLSMAMNGLDIRDAERVKTFKRHIRTLFATFLRFTHRYWFREVSIHIPARPIFALFRRHHGTDALYDDIRVAVQDMAQYLEADGLRRQANTVVRLTVVTTFGLIGSIVTGLLGMNLIAVADATLSVKLIYFMAAFVPTTAVILYTVMISKRLSDMLESLSDERLSVVAKLKMFVRSWFSNRWDR